MPSKKEKREYDKRYQEDWRLNLLDALEERQIERLNALTESALEDKAMYYSPGNGYRIITLPPIEGMKG